MKLQRENEGRKVHAIGRIKQSGMGKIKRKERRVKEKVLERMDVKRGGKKEQEKDREREEEIESK